MKYAEIEQRLRKFKPSQKRHIHPTGMMYTNGVLYIINDCELRWLVDVIASFQQTPAIATDTDQWLWQSWEFQNILCFFDREKLSLQPVWSNLYLVRELQLLLIDGCLMLPSENVGS